MHQPLADPTAAFLIGSSLRRLVSPHCPPYNPRSMGSRPSDLRAKRWLIKPAISAEFQNSLSGIHPVLTQVLFNRGMTEPAQIQSFLECRYAESDDPFLMTDMDLAVERIAHAIDKDQNIVVYGDFDADGVTSTVLLTEALRGLGMRRSQARPYIPDRVDEGYGLNKDALTKIKEEFEADLVITVDCGIRSVEEVAHANAIGLDLIVTDHHSIGPELPPALAIVNPKRESAYPEKMLAGVRNRLQAGAGAVQFTAAAGCL